MLSMEGYFPDLYWQERLSQCFNLTGAGCIALGPFYNVHLYKARLKALEQGMATVGRSFKGSTVLEIGCGTGFYTEYCAHQGVRDYVGLDIASVSIHTLQRRFPHFKFIQADVSNDTFPDIESFDIILAADVLFHIVSNEAFKQALQNLFLHLNLGGLLIVSDLFPPNTIRVAPHVCFHSMSEYSYLFDQHQMRILHQEPIFFLLYPIPLMLKLNLTAKVEGRSNWIRKHVRKLITWNVFDRLLPPVLGWLDEKIFLHLSKFATPYSAFYTLNMKWTFATREDAR